MKVVYSGIYFAFNRKQVSQRKSMNWDFYSLTSCEASDSTMENIPDCRRNVILPHSSPNKNGRTECSRYCSYPLRTQVVRLWVGKCPFGRIFFPYIEHNGLMSDPLINIFSSPDNCWLSMTIPAISPVQFGRYRFFSYIRINEYLKSIIWKYITLKPVSLTGCWDVSKV